MKNVLLATTALVLVGAVGSVANAQAVNINFGSYSSGTTISSLDGFTFNTFGGPGPSGAPMTDGSGLTNSTTAAYPTGNILDVNFNGTVNNISFTFNNEGSSPSGRGDTYVYAYNSTGGLLQALEIGPESAEGGSFTLSASNVADLQFDNGSAGTDSWIFDLNTLSANGGAPVPEPASMALLGFGALAGGLLRRKRAR